MLIGLTGTLGSGKGTVVEYLKSKGFKHFAVSDTFLAGEAVRRGLVPDRTTRRDIANEYRAKGPTKLMEAVYAIAEEAIKARENVIIEPQHTPSEVEFTKAKGGVELAVDAEITLRFKRIQERGSAKDNVTFEQFKAEEDLEMVQTDPNKNNLRACIALATYHIENNSSLENLHAQIDEVLAKLHQRA